MYEVKRINDETYQVLKKGKLLTSFRGKYASNDAVDYAQQCVENDQWNASNRD